MKIQGKTEIKRSKIEKDKTKWTTMAIRNATRDKLDLLAHYEHRTAGEMVAVMMRDYYSKIGKELKMNEKELSKFLITYKRD
tara:strand:- start:11 stop:256 length:246 start_codon:yes stop_codon:yes gene_type:complete